MSVKVELTVDEARFLRGDDSGTAGGGCATVAHSALGKLKAALAKHEREEKRRHLRLPWGFDTGDAGVGVRLADHRGIVGVKTLVPNEEVARLMAAAPDLANVLEDVLMFLESDCKELPCHPEIKVAKAALKKAGW